VCGLEASENSSYGFAETELRRGVLPWIDDLRCAFSVFTYGSLHVDRFCIVRGLGTAMVRRFSRTKGRKGTDGPSYDYAHVRVFIVLLTLTELMFLKPDVYAYYQGIITTSLIMREAVAGN